jgi:hypothetical protein
MMPSLVYILCAVATITAVLVPGVALRKCANCGELALRTADRTHRCPSRFYSVLAHGWIGLVLLWTGTALAATALFDL